MASACLHTVACFKPQNFATLIEPHATSSSPRNHKSTFCRNRLVFPGCRKTIRRPVHYPQMFIILNCRPRRQLPLVRAVKPSLEQLAGVGRVNVVRPQYRAVQKLFVFVDPIGVKVVRKGIVITFEQLPMKPQLQRKQLFAHTHHLGSGARHAPYRLAGYQRKRQKSIAHPARWRPEVILLAAT